LASSQAVEQAVVQDVVLRNWDLGDGLPSTRINSMIRTPDGYLWLATQRGLVRFDGLRFVTVDITNIPPTQPQRVTSLLADDKGELWVGSNGLLLRQSGQGFVAQNLEKVTAGSRLNGLAQDAQGALWVATEGVGLVRFQRGHAEKFDAASDLPSAAVEQVLSDIAGKVWAVTGGRLVTFEEGRWREPDGAPAPPETVQAISRARDGGLWVATAERGPLGNRIAHLRRLKAGAWSAEPGPYPWEQITAQSHGTVLFEDRSGRFWCATAGEIFSRKPASPWERLVSVAPWVQFEVLCLADDESGALWIGTRTMGLLQIQQRPVTTLLLPSAASQNPVLTACVGRDGSVWGGTDGAGILCWRNGEIRQFGGGQGLTDLRVAALLEDRQATLWAGTFAGLFRRVGERFEPVPGPHALREPTLALCEDRAGSLWVGGQGGVVQIKTNGVEFFGRGEGLAVTPVHALTQDGEGRIWAGTDEGGLFCLEGGRFRRVPTPRGAVPWTIHALHCDTAGSLWIGTDFSGLLRLRNGQFDHWDWSRDGLPSNFILAIAEDKSGNLWMSSENGVFGSSKHMLDDALPPGRQRLQPWRLTTADGLAHKVCSGIGQPAAAQSGDGRLWFPDGPALAQFDPAKVCRAVAVSSPVVESVRVDGVPVPITAEALRVQSGARQIEFQYTSPNMVLPDRLRFRIRMSGLDSDWVAVGARRDVAYYRLLPGDYEFRVMASGPENQWQESRCLRLEVVPRFWERRSTQFAGLLTLLATVAATVWRVERNRSRRRLEKLEMQRNLERERARIARDIHDDLGASLTHITMLSQSARSRPESALQTGGEVDQIYGTARELTRAMEEVVWAVNPKHDTLDSLANYLGIYAQDFAAASGLRCRLYLPVRLSEKPLSSQVRHNLFLAFKEALHNVARHAGATEVRVALKHEDRTFTLSVEDNGRGFRREQADATPAAPGQRASRLTSGNGLANMQSRLQEVGGRYEIETEYGLGTRVRFTVPFVT
jgi:ligand-binding sensor domain-containing protein/signal transduction histidine kinase